MAAGHTLILTFAVLRALSGFPHAVTRPGLYWVHAMWLALALVQCLVSFWAFWSYREVEWTLFRFMGALEIPALIFVYNSILVPSDPAAVASWRDYFFRVRIPLFATGALLLISVTISNYLVLGTLRHPVILSDLGFLTINVVGLASANTNLHSLLPLGFLLLGIASGVAVIAQPDSLLRMVP